MAFRSLEVSVRPSVSKMLGRADVWLLVAFVIGLVGFSTANLLPGNRQEPQARLVLEASAANDLAGFARASGPQPLSFPADFGPHPDYQTEWWYYTGNLEAEGGRHFGYQLTFFRRALEPTGDRTPRASTWATEDVYMAHFAVTDVSASGHHAFERFARGAAGLAGAQSYPYRVWLEDWLVEEVGSDRVRLRATQGDLMIDLLLIDRKGPILQGDRGYSQKGPEVGNASYYYSQTRLETAGMLRLGEAEYSVHGTSWKDHEYSTSALASDQIGWDWFAVQLDNDTELMFFQIRKEDGTIDPFSSGTFIDIGGGTTPLKRDDVSIDVQEVWRSSRSKAIYPARWVVNVPALDLTLDIIPHVAEQELNVSFSYWEGAVRLTGQWGGRPVDGHGYVELTGYAGSMQRQF
jgi:predicted secreted hydrolase